LHKALNEDRGRELDAQMKAAIIGKEEVKQTGFIAQDVERAARQVGYNFSGVDAPKKDSDFYGLRYAEFVVPLVKAVQELNEQIVNLNLLTYDLLSEVEQLKADVHIKGSNIDKQQVEIHLMKERMDQLESILKVDNIDF
jgi:hypothetical protein